MTRRRQCAPMQQPRRQSTDSSRRAIYILYILYFCTYLMAAETGHAELLSPIILQVCCLHESHDESSDGSLKSGTRVSLRHCREVENVRGVADHEFEVPYALASIAFDLHGRLKGVVHPRGTGPPSRRSNAALPNCNWLPWRLGTMGCHRQGLDAASGH